MFRLPCFCAFCVRGERWGLGENPDDAKPSLWSSVYLELSNYCVVFNHAALRGEKNKAKVFFFHFRAFSMEKRENLCGQRVISPVVTIRSPADGQRNRLTCVCCWTKLIWLVVFIIIADTYARGCSIPVSTYDHPRHSSSSSVHVSSTKIVA